MSALELLGRLLGTGIILWFLLAVAATRCESTFTTSYKVFIRMAWAVFIADAGLLTLLVWLIPA